jgi:hypothetical protein
MFLCSVWTRTLQKTSLMAMFGELSRKIAHSKMPSPNLSSVLEELQLVNVSISKHLPAAVCDKSGNFVT